MKKVLFFLLAVLLMFNTARLSAQSMSLTVADGTVTDSYIPIYGFYLDAACHNQVIYPESMLSDMLGGVVSSITFYMSSVPSTPWSHTFQFGLGTTNVADFSSESLITTGISTVYTGTISVASQFTITLSTPFVYSGGNLVLDMQNTPGGYSSGNFYGVTATQPAARYTYSSTANNRNFIPKTTFTYSAGATCIAPSAFQVSDINDSEATLSWSPRGGEISWDIYLTSDATDVPDEYTTPTYTATDTTHFLQGLNPHTRYYVYIRANCGSSDVSIWRNISFMTSQVPAQLPYICDFEDNTVSSQWGITGDGVNQWVIDTAVNNTPNGMYALYVSNDSGATNSYSHSTSTSWAYRDIDFGTNYAEYNFSCDVKINGESTSWDYLKVYLGPPAELPASASSSGAMPAGATLLGTFSKLNSWTPISAVVNSSFSGVQRLYLLWWNDSGGGSNPPAAVDNISITGTNCERPYNIAVDSGAVTQNAITIHFTPALATDNAWEAIILAPGDAIDETQVVTLSDTTYTFTGLNADTPYRIFVRTNCGSETSFWSDEFAIRTECPQYMSIPYAENFDTYGTGSSSTSYPSCWTRMHTTTSTYPYISSTTPSTPPGNLYFYSTTSTASYAIAPEVDVMTNPINTLTVYFKIKKTSTSSGHGALQVGVMSDPADITTFTPVQAFTGAEWDATSTWYDVEVDLASYTGTGAYIALMKSSTAGYTYVDDFEVSTTPSCLRPMDVELSAITDNSVTISWTARSNETTWQVAVVPAGSDVSLATPETVYSNPCTISNLTDNTAYDVYVKADCGGGDESNWSSSVSFSTRCLPTSVVPFTESFEGLGTGTTAYPNCWIRMTNGTTAYPYISNTYASDGQSSLYFYSATNTYSLATTQALDLSTYTANSLHLTFKARKTASGYGRMDVGVMTDPSDLNTFTLLKSIYPSDYEAASVWCEFDIPLTEAYETGNVYLAFYAINGITSYVYIDDVVLDYQPECSAPTNLTISQVEGASALVSWEPAAYGALDYTVEYSEAGMENWMAVVSGVTTTSCFITGLTPQTAYDVRVSTNCTSGEMQYVSESFVTGCLAGGEIAIDHGTTTNYYVPSHTNYRYSFSQQLYTAAELGGNTTLTGMKFYISTSTNQTRNWDIYLGNETTTSLTGYTSIASHTKVFSGTVSMATTGWLEITFDTTFAYTGGSLVVSVDDNTGDYNSSTYFRAHSGTTSYSVYSDVTNYPPTSPGVLTSRTYRNDVIFMGNCDSTATCVAPNVRVTDVNSYSVTLDWAPGSTESSWEMEYKAATQTTWTSVGSVSASPYVLDNLTSNTLYQIRMRSDCGGEYSDWVIVDAQTECEAITTLPYVQNFDAATGSGSGNFIDCWYKGTNSTSTQYPHTSNSQSSSPDYSLYFYGNSSYYSYAATPRFTDEIMMNNLQVSFKARKSADSDFIEVGIMTDPTDFSTFEVVGSFSPSTLNAWELVDINTDSYTGTGRYIAFRAPQWITNNIYLDDVDIHEIPYCDRVEDVVASQITVNSATVSWTPRGTESSWEVLYAPVGTIDYETMTPEFVSGTPSVTLSNLSASTPYDVAVRAICDNGEIAAWTTGTFRTECGTIASLPYTENFETFETGSNNPVYCWTRNSTHNVNYPYVSASYAYSGGKSLCFYSESANYNAVAMPQLDATIPMNTVEVLFQMRASDVNNMLIVGVMTNPADMTTFVPIDTAIVSATNTFEWFSVSLASYTGTGTYVAFQNSTTTSSSIYLDDVVLNTLPTCARPYDAVATSTPTDMVQLAWTDPVGTTWDVIYGPMGFDPETSTESTLLSGLTTTSVDIQGLTAGIIYEFYVRSDCGGDVSPWCYIPAVGSPYIYVMNMVTDTITACGVTVVDDGGMSGDYSNSLDNVLIIYPAEADSLLSISGTFVGESSIDYLSVYEGVGVDEDKLLQKIVSGTSGNLVNFGPLVSEFGPLTLKFHSDGSIVHDGFVASVNCVSPPSCRRALDVEIQTVAATTADLQWTTMGTTYSGFNVAVSTQPGFSPDTCTLLFTTATTNVQLTGLNPNTTYYAMVQADCGGGDVSEWSDMVSFMTAGNTAQIPYFSDFTNATEVADWNIYNGTQTNKWYIGTPSGATNPLLFVSNDNGVSNDYTISSSSYVWACRDIDFGNFAEYELSFKWKTQGESCCDYIDVFIGNPALPANSSAIPEGLVRLNVNHLNQNASGAYFTATLDARYANTVKRLYFLWRNDFSTGTNPAGSVDSISIVGSTCGRPYDLHINSLTQTSADIAFTPAMSTDMTWEYLFGPAGTDPATMSPVVITDTLVQLTGLAHSTAYDFYVRTVCDNGEYSDWSELFSFFTECGNISTLPYTETFDTYGTGTSAYPQCWTKLTNYSNYPYISTTSHSGAGSLYFYAYSDDYNIAISKEIDTDVNPMNTLEVNFWYRPGSATSAMVVGVMTNPEDLTTFVPVDTVTGAASAWAEHTVYLAAYTGTGRHIAFRNAYTTANSYGYIDDVTIDVAPSCLPVVNVSVSNISQTEVTISWTDVNNATSWNIEYGPSGFAQGQGTVVSGVTNPYTLTGLSASTSYDVYVQAACSTTDQSEWSSVATFATECDVISVLPYFEDFNSYATSSNSSVAPSDYPNDVLPTCWSFLNRSTTSSTYPSAFLTSHSMYVVSGNCLFFKSSNSTPLYAVLPQFSEAIQNLQMTFTYRNEGTSDFNGTLAVGYMTDPTNASTYVELNSYTRTTTLTEVTVLFDAVPATVTDAYIVFKYTGTSNNYYLSIDDVEVDQVAVADPCDAPTNVQVVPASNAATVTWTSAESSWVVEYKLATASNWTASPTLTATTYNITGLTASTDYVVRVKSVCDDANESDWSAEVPFTTLAGDVTTYTITATATGPGSITPNGTVTVQEGSDITFNFTPDAGAEVSGLLVDDVETAIPADNSYTFSAVVANHTIAVAFEEDETGIEELDLDAAVVLYPNPATSHILINVADARFLGAEMQIFDVYGKLIANTTIETLSTQVDVSQLANGMYMVRINANDGMVTKRFVKR